MTEEEAIFVIENAIRESERVIKELKGIKGKAKRCNMVGEYYSNLNNCQKEVEACKMAIAALRKQMQKEPVMKQNFDDSDLSSFRMMWKAVKQYFGRP